VKNEKKGNTATPISADTSNKAIVTRCKAIARKAVDLNEAIHETGLMVMAHTAAYDDCTGAARLVNAMPKSHRRSLVVTWFERYSPIIVEVSGGIAKAHLAKNGSKKDKPFAIDEARENPFHSMPEVDEEPGFFTVEDALESVDRLAGKLARLAKGEGKQEVAPADIERVKLLAVMLKTLKLPDVVKPANEQQQAEPPVQIAA
jgi:hypothetical protein